MLKTILLGFSVLSNTATLIGLWIAYVSAPATVQNHVAHILLIAGAICSIVLYLFLAWLVLRPQSSPLPEPPHITKNHIYIGPRGIPVSLVNDGARVDVVIFSAVDVELRYMKVMMSKVGTTNEFVMLESAEPMGIAAFDAVNKKIERSLTAEEVARLWGATTVFIAGTAKFSSGIEVTFTFMDKAFR